jgi:hypothetical protein
MSMHEKLMFCAKTLNIHPEIQTDSGCQVQ